MNTLDIQTVKKELPIFTSKLNNHQEINSYLIKVIEDHRKNNPEPTQSNVKAWHSSWQTHDINKNFQPIIDIILGACEFISDGYFKQKIKFKCHNMWAMVYENGEYANKHSHYPSDFACVYYVDVEPNCSPIVFEDNLKIQPENGLLVIFPAILEHEVPPTSSKRIAISMNIDKAI